MNEELIKRLLKSYVTVETGAELDEILQQLSKATGFEVELCIDAIHCQFPHLHDVVIGELKQENIIRSIPILPLF